MKDRGMMKWMPFDSLSSSKQMVSEILKEKRKKEKPLMSDDQLFEIEQKLKEAYHSRIPVQIIYFYQGNFQEKVNIIWQIFHDQKRILFQDGSSLYFDQILSVSFR